MDRDDIVKGSVYVWERTGGRWVAVAFDSWGWYFQPARKDGVRPMRNRATSTLPLEQLTPAPPMPEKVDRRKQKGVGS